MNSSSKDKTEASSGSLAGRVQLARVKQGAALAGVCSGLAKSTGFSVLIWRGLFVLALGLFGLGAVAYGVLWAVMKKDPVPDEQVEPLFRRIDWLTAGVTTAVVLTGYLLTLAPDLTLEDSGELAVGSFYAGVPHPPGYPVWTIYTWLFTVLLPFSNIAWRVAVSSAVAAAFSCGLVALIASRGCSLILESFEEFRQLARRWENALCMSAGYVAGMLIGFNGFLWSQAVIVEVYTLSLLSFVVTLATLLRWIYAQDQLRYLYLSLFMFGVCVTNHQTLIVAAMGIELGIAAARPRLGRDLFAINSVMFLFGLLAKSQHWVTAFEQNGPLYAIFLLIGIGSIAAYAYLAFKTGELVHRQTMSVGVCMGLFWILGASLYFYMPLASMTNPPMNWGYARTWEGFLHALTRGQYERTNPTSDLGRFMDQLSMLLDGAVDEFNLVYLVLALLPFFFFMRMKQREKAWLLGLVGMYLCLAVLLIVLLNPAADRQSREMNRVFFVASHVMISLCVAYGLAIFGALLATQYKDYRSLAVYGGAVASAMALFAVTVTFADEQESMMASWGLFSLSPSWDPLVRFTSVFILVLAVGATALFIFSKERISLTALIAVFVVMPVESILSHWSDNEQRGHLFGFWFGHDMFEPPFELYPSMEENAILFGGTDPGRFCPTYMIFCESFLPARCKRDPEFDRRDVYIITQNALADQTYLSYIRAHYFRSAQVDTPFLQGMVGGIQEKLMDRDQLERKYSGMAHRTNGLAQGVGGLKTILRPIDNVITKWGAGVEEARRQEGVYPPKEIYTPTLEDHGRCMADYFSDADRRRQLGQLKPGENVAIGPDGKLQVAGQVSVMAINGLLTKVIFDKNPDNEFYVEESFPLDWMFPHLEPFGIIMKINREPLVEMTQEQVDRDHEFWSQYSERLIGNWITYDTPASEICDFAVRVYERKNYDGFLGDRKFARDKQAQKSFSKLRSSIGGLYLWRMNNIQNPEENARMLKEAEFALKQSFAFCPYSPEAVYRYTDLLARSGRLEDAERVAETCLRFDQDNPSIQGLLFQVQQIRQGRVALADPATSTTQADLASLEQQYAANPADGDVAFRLASLYLKQGQSDAAVKVLDDLGSRPDADLNTVLSVATVFAQLGKGQLLEKMLSRMVALAPENPEAWYDLASTQAVMGKPDEAMKNLLQAIRLSDARRQQDANARDLRLDAITNGGFASLRDRDDFKSMVSPP